MEPILKFRPVQGAMKQLWVERDNARTIGAVHMHDVEELLFITSKTKCRLAHNGDSFYVQGPALVLNRAGCYHQTFQDQDAGESYRSWVLFFRENMVGDLQKTSPVFAHRFLAMEMDQAEATRFRSYFELLSLSEDGGEESRLLLQGMVCAMAEMLGAGHSCIQADTAEDYIFQLIRDLMLSPTAESSAAALAPRYHVSPSKLKADFHRVTGTSIKHFTLRLRLEKAATLLTLPGATVMSVALECGFGGESHFIAAFREYTGTTPGAYLRQNRSG